MDKDQTQKKPTSKPRTWPTWFIVLGNSGSSWKSSVLGCYSHQRVFPGTSLQPFSVSRIAQKMATAGGESFLVIFYSAVFPGDNWGAQFILLALWFSWLFCSICNLEIFLANSLHTCFIPPSVRPYSCSQLGAAHISVCGGPWRAPQGEAPSPLPLLISCVKDHF